MTDSSGVGIDRPIIGLLNSIFGVVTDHVVLLCCTAPTLRGWSSLSFFIYHHPVSDDFRTHFFFYGSAIV